MLRDNLCRTYGINAEVKAIVATLYVRVCTSKLEILENANTVEMLRNDLLNNQPALSSRAG